jgi:hypothetical protein
MVMTSVVSDRHALPVSEPAEPEVTERATRRVFSAQYKLKILAEYERRDRDGKSALLRREGLYTYRRSPNGVSSGMRERCRRWARRLVGHRSIRASTSWRGCDTRMRGCSPTWRKPGV